MAPNRRLVLPLLAALALAALVVGVSACGYESHEKEVVEGEPVEVGELSINVTFSRFLNPDDNEDSAYLVGQPPPQPGYAYFGIFLEVQNESDEEQTVPTMTVFDAAGESYSAYPSESLYALQFGETVEPEEQLPVLDSTAQQGPIEGALLIFKLPDSVSDERPLALHIEGEEEAEVELDL
ncbi:MAG: hypothetical protein WA862_12460 [Solirubrobacterales bacterium]